jgi:hypothetical protein
MACCSKRLAVRLIQTGKGQWHQLGKVFGEEDQGAFAEHVLDGVDAAIVGKGHTQQALVAGVAQFIGEQEGEIEGRQLVGVLVVGISGIPDLGLDGGSLYYKMSI